MTKYQFCKYRDDSEGALLSWSTSKLSVPMASLVCRESVHASSIFGFYQVSQPQELQWTSSLIPSESVSWRHNDVANGMVRHAIH
jgi:hypothetical protein